MEKKKTNDKVDGCCEQRDMKMVGLEREMADDRRRW